MNSFRTVLERAQAEITEKKSRFIATVIPAGQEADAGRLLSELRKKYWDANHNVYAYRIGLEKTIERFSDDKEPVHTAGMPVLSLLRKEELLNVCVVVTRYFGGTLLGTGGLVRAYSKAAQEALQKARMITKEPYAKYGLDLDYAMLGKLQYTLSEKGWTVLDTQYEDHVRMKLLIPLKEREEFLKTVEEASDGRLHPVSRETVLAACDGGEWHYFEMPEEK